MATSYQDDYMKTALRLPRDLHAKIQEAATTSGKSLNSELIARLDESFDPKPDQTLLRHLAETRMKLAQRDLELTLVASTSGMLADMAAYLGDQLIQKGGLDLAANMVESLQRAIKRGREFRTEYSDREQRVQLLVASLEALKVAEKEFNDQVEARRSLSSPEGGAEPNATRVKTRTAGAKFVKATRSRPSSKDEG